MSTVGRTLLSTPFSNAPFQCRLENDVKCHLDQRQDVGSCFTGWSQADLPAKDPVFTSGGLGMGHGSSRGKPKSKPMRTTFTGREPYPMLYELGTFESINGTLTAGPKDPGAIPT
ncbi:hypothetical protein chiPu_0020555 [Chiloscyllium punctatum]|uniref:Uncharacterized protein n=1 Tax=Chiloscyllium punctatum TaxID=137246 RepID=A0A401RGY0_CHIPU|nr:hypothetical protein [Chiloscyllium punctatum]